MPTNHFSSQRVIGERVIYTASPFAKQNLIYLQEIGTSNYLQPYSSKRNNLASYLFFIVHNGSGSLKYQNVSYSLSTGDCAFINCDTEYTISSEENLWTLSWIHFNGPTMHAIHEKYIERCGAPCFTAVNPQQFETLHKEIFDASTEECYVRDMTLMSGLTDLLTALMECCWGKAPANINATSVNKWHAVKEFLDANFVSDIQLDDLSEQFEINKFYLTRKFKETYGITINQYLLNKRIAKSKELLRFSDFSITELSSLCGFNDIAYFTRVFKAIEGIPPSEFKKRWHSAFPK